MIVILVPRGKSAGRLIWTATRPQSIPYATRPTRARAAQAGLDDEIRQTFAVLLPVPQAFAAAVVEVDGY
jgi:hypothetical protein